MLRLCAGANINTNRCLYWKQQVVSVDQQSVRGGHWIWWIISMGDILHLAVIHQQMFVVVCLHCRTTLLFHKHLTPITPTWWWCLPPSCINTLDGSLSKLFQKQLRQEKGGGGENRHRERREKAWHRDYHIKTSVISSRSSYCLPQHFSQVSISRSSTSPFSALPPHLLSISSFITFCAFCSTCVFSFFRRFFCVVWMSAAWQSKVIPVNTWLCSLGWHVKQRAEFIAVAICSAESVLQH